MRMSWRAELCCKSLCSVWGRSHMYWVHGSLPRRLFVDIGTAVFTFDLFYICSGHQNWLNLDKRVLEHDFARRAGSLVLIFAVRWEIVLIVYFFNLMKYANSHFYWPLNVSNFFIFEHLSVLLNEILLYEEVFIDDLPLIDWIDFQVLCWEYSLA